MERVISEENLPPSHDHSNQKGMRRLRQRLRKIRRGALKERIIGLGGLVFWRYYLLHFLAGRKLLFKMEVLVFHFF